MGDDAATRLRAAGLRVTAPRVATLTMLSEGGHFSADEVADHVQHRLGSVSTQAVYDVLRALTEAGLARRIEPAGSSGRYEARTGDNHHHAVCRVCGRVEDVDCAVGEAPCMDPGSPPALAGFHVDEAEVTFWGQCASCRDAAG